MMPRPVTTPVTLLCSTRTCSTSCSSRTLTPFCTAFSASARVASNGDTIPAVGHHKAPTTPRARFGSLSSRPSLESISSFGTPFSLPRQSSSSSTRKLSCSSATTSEPIHLSRMPSSASSWRYSTLPRTLNKAFFVPGAASNPA